MRAQNTACAPICNQLAKASLAIINYRPVECGKGNGCSHDIVMALCISLRQTYTPILGIGEAAVRHETFTGRLGIGQQCVLDRNPRLIAC